MFGAFSRLNYRPWYAIAEFVDNSLESFLHNRSRIRSVDRCNPQLTVRIEVEQDRISVTDTAAGIATEDFARAFAPAAPPPNTSGLSEYGLGMKAAACWFARKWHVCTTAIEEPIERTVCFDVPHIIAENVEDLTPDQRSVPATEHRTQVVLEDLHVRPRGRTINKIKTHLASIYRIFLRRGDLVIYFNGQALSYQDPEVLNAPYYRSPTTPALKWRKDFDITLDDQHRAWGWAAIRDRASLSEAGFAVFRRDRLIQGSFDETYRPEHIFRKPNSFTYQRLFGEFHVEGFQVTHTKDGLQWEEWEELILADIRRELDADPVRLLDQAEGHRQTKARTVPETFGAEAVQGTANAVQNHLPPVVDSQVRMTPESTPPPTVLPDVPIHFSRTVELQGSRKWRVSLELARHEGQLDWLAFSQASPSRGSVDHDEIHIRINLDHPFSERFILHTDETIEPLLRIATGLVIAEMTALEAGAAQSTRTIRRNLNHLLREALWRP